MAPIALHWRSWNLMWYLFILIKHNVHIIGVLKRCQEGCGNILHCCISLPWCVVDGFIPINEFMIYWLQWSCWEYCQFLNQCGFVPFSHIPILTAEGLKGLERAHVWKVEIDGCPQWRPKLTLLHLFTRLFCTEIFPHSSENLQGYYNW